MRNFKGKTYPNMKAKEAEFDRLAAEYLEKEGLEEDAEGNLVKVGN